MKIDGISAVVTGGASGLGLATARALIARRAKVVIADQSEDAGRASVEELGASACFVQANVTS